MKLCITIYKCTNEDKLSILKSNKQMDMENAVNDIIK